MGRLAVILGYACASLACFGMMQLLQPVRVAGASMEPALHAGDLVLVSRGRVTRGDIALLQRPGQGAVLHRIISVHRDGAVRTRGDANPTPDPQPTNKAHVAGRVVCVVPVGRALKRWRE